MNRVSGLLKHCHCCCVERNPAKIGFLDVKATGHRALLYTCSEHALLGAGAGLKLFAYVF